MLSPPPSSTAILFYMKLDEVSHPLYPSHSSLPRPWLCFNSPFVSVTFVDDLRGVTFQDNIKYPTNEKVTWKPVPLGTASASL